MPLLLSRLLPSFSLAIAFVASCSDAKPRPVVVEESDAAVDASPTIDAGPDAACALPASFGSSSCNACVSRTCCDVLAACLADKDCKARVECERPCIDDPDAGGCVSACETAIPDDKSLHFELSGCVYFRPPCETDCASTR